MLREDIVFGRHTLRARASKLCRTLHRHFTASKAACVTSHLHTDGLLFLAKVRQQVKQVETHLRVSSLSSTYRSMLVLAAIRGSMTVEVSAPSFCDHVFPLIADELGKSYVIAPVIAIEEHPEVKVIAVS